MKVDGKLYGLPYDTGPMVMFYNKDIFEKAGVAEAEAGLDGRRVRGRGAAAQGDRHPESGLDRRRPPTLESMVLGYNGGRRDRRPTAARRIEREVRARALDWIGGLVKNGYADPGQSPDGSHAETTTFAAGKVAMYSDGPWSLISQKAKVKFDLGITTIPSGTDGPQPFAAGSGFGISKQCKYPEQAFKAISTMTSEKPADVARRAGPAPSPAAPRRSRPGTRRRHRRRRGRAEDRTRRSRAAARQQAERPAVTSCSRSTRCRR